MFSGSLRIVTVALVAGFLSACETPANAPTWPELTWGHLAPITFKAGSVEFVDNYVAPLKSPNLDHEFPTTPQAALQRWTIDRIHAGDDTLNGVRVTILDASAVGVPLKTKDGIKGLFYKEQAFRINAALEALIEVRDSTGRVKSRAQARVIRRRTRRANGNRHHQEKRQNPRRDLLKSFWHIHSPLRLATKTAIPAEQINDKIKFFQVCLHHNYAREWAAFTIFPSFALAKSRPNIPRPQSGAAIKRSASI